MITQKEYLNQIKEQFPDTYLQLLKDFFNYKRIHKHSILNKKAKIDCQMCYKEFQDKWDSISNT